MSLIQEISLSKDDINLIISALEQAEELSMWDDLTMSNQDKYFEDSDRYFSPHCDPHKRAKKLAQLLKWSGDLSGKQTICRIKFSSLHAEVNKNGRPVQEGVGVDKPNL
jgi:hypothetical protein|tara:strand:- start:416 stop:742 length:327 start_codon:yes stop_codon:yes gene_type:complete